MKEVDFVFWNNIFEGYFVYVSHSRYADRIVVSLLLSATPPSSAHIPLGVAKAQGGFDF